MQLADKQFKYNSAIDLSFRKPISHEVDKVAKLAEKNCDEMFDLKIQDMFSSSVQDLAASPAVKELDVDKVECGMHQGDKVGASAFGELARTVDEVNFLFFYSWFVLIIQFISCLFSLIFTRKW